MQISELEIAKLLSTEKLVSAKKSESNIEFTQITPDALPQTVEPDPSEIAHVKEIVNAAPDVREDIVMQLKERIEKGEYHVSGEEIANMMIRRMKADRIR